MQITRERFDEYITRFNACDATAFEDFLTDDMQMRNGNLRYTGVQGMKDHYAKIWKLMKETLHVRNFVSGDGVLAVELYTLFEVLKDTDDSPFGPIKKGEKFEYEGLIMYRVTDEGKFSDIKVSYLDFARTFLNGEKKSLGIAH